MIGTKKKFWDTGVRDTKVSLYCSMDSCDNPIDKEYLEINFDWNPEINHLVNCIYQSADVWGICSLYAGYYKNFSDP